MATKMTPAQRRTEIRAALVAGRTRGWIVANIGGGQHVFTRIRAELEAEGFTFRKHTRRDTLPQTPASAEREAIIRKLHAEGDNNSDIARALGIDPVSVRYWLKKLGLTTNCPRGSAAFRAACTENNRENQTYIISGDVEANVRTLYARGMNDTGIAVQIGCNAGTITRWRARNNLPINTVVRANPVRRDALYAKAARLVGRGMAPDVADDAISDIVLAVVSGEIAEADIATAGPKIINRTFGTWASRFSKTSSLDEMRDGEDGWTLYSKIADTDQEAAMRVAELSALATRLGLDVDAILADDGEAPETWSNRRSQRRYADRRATPAQRVATPAYAARRVAG